MIKFCGELIAHIKECAMSYGANPRTEIFVRDGADGPMKQIAQVKMGADARGRYIILETSPVIVN